jgi:hypothetical protein
MQSRVKSLSQNTGAFIYTTGTFTKVYPVTSTAKAGETLADFARDVGVPTDLRADRILLGVTQNLSRSRSDYGSR